ncbi:MAG TPA: alpha/beta fold hydrolase [Rhodobacteraceae bacterium]|nr:alpha/beta fold hydrolase [Paracoccaceae bacterium]
MIWWPAGLAVAGLIALPYLLEARRGRADPVALARADGSYALLPDGATYFRWFGAGTGPILVMVHGLSTPSWVFMGLVDGLTMLGFRVLTYDLYGRGLSARPKLVHDRALFIRQLEGLLAQQGISGPVTLLGYSMGGAIAVAFAAAHPGRVARLILLAPAGIDYRPAPLLANAARWGRFGDWLWGLLGARFLQRGAAREARGPTVIPDLAARIRRETRTKGYLAAILSSERNMLAEVQEDAHRQIAEAGTPVMAIWGEADTVIPLTAMGKLSKWNRAAYQYVLPGAGHGLGYTRPKEILAAIEEHLRQT